MVIVDKTGRKLKIGQILDTNLIGMYQGKIIGIKEQPIVLSPQQQFPPHIVIAMNITPFIRPDGLVPDVYILQDPDPKDPLVIEAANQNSRIIKP